MDGTANLGRKRTGGGTLMAQGVNDKATPWVSLYFCG